MYSYFSDRNKNNETLFSKRGSSSVPVDSLEPQAMALFVTSPEPASIAVGGDSPITDEEGEVVNPGIGAAHTELGSPPPTSPTRLPQAKYGGVKSPPVSTPPPKPFYKQINTPVLEPQGTATAAPPTAEPGQAPRLDPWAESRAMATMASNAVTVSEANFQRMMEFWQKVTEKQEQRIEELMKELKERSGEDVKKYSAKNLPSIDIKDVKKPDEYDGDEKGFNIWYARFKSLLVNRHAPWKEVFDTIEKFQGTAINNQDGAHTEFKTKLPANSPVAEDPEAYATQLLAYMSSYSKGALHARVLKTQGGQIFEMFRDVVHKGKNRNKNRLLALKAAVLSPPRASNAGELEKILVDWEFQINLNKEYEDSYTITEDTKITILLNIMPKEYIKDMRDVYNRGECMNDFHKFRQRLLDEIADRRQDMEGVKGLKNIGALSEENSGESKGQEEEYGEVDVWVESMQCWVNGMAPLGALAHKRAAGDDAGDGNRDDKKRRDECYNCGETGHRAFECTKPKVEKGTAKGKGKKGGGKGGKGGKGTRMPGPCWTCGGPHLAHECPTAGKGGKGFPVPAAWSSWRPPTFAGPSPQQWRQWMLRKGADKGKGKGK